MRHYDSFGRFHGVDEDADCVYRNGRAYPRWINCGGEIRTREEYPYSYSFFVSHGPVEQFRGEGYGGVYSDRLREWDSDKWNAAWAMMPSNRFAGLSLSDLSRFLTRYFGKQVECVQALEGCNVSNGYPLWYFVYRNAQAMSAGTAETAQQAQSEARQRGPKDAPHTPSPIGDPHA